MNKDQKRNFKKPVNLRLSCGFTRLSGYGLNSAVDSSAQAFKGTKVYLNGGRDPPATLWVGMKASC